MSDFETPTPQEEPENNGLSASEQKLAELNKELLTDATKGSRAGTERQQRQSEENISRANDDIDAAQQKTRKGKALLDQAAQRGEKIQQLDQEIEEDEEIRAKAKEDADATCVQLMESFPEGTNIPQFVQDLCK